MKQQLMIRLAEDPHSPVSWVLLDESGRPQHTVHEGSLQQAAGQAGDCDVIVLVPSSDVLVTAASVPGGKHRQLAKILPYMLEDQLVDEVETQHIASRASVNGKVHAAVASRAMMDGWVARIRDAGIHMQAMIPESFAVPHTPGTWSVLLLEDGGVLIRISAMQVMYTDRQQAGFMLQRLLDEHREDRPDEIRVYRCSETDDLPAMSLPDDIRVSMQSPVNPAVYTLAGGYAGDAAINLLQGAYTPRHSSPRTAMLWKTAAGLFVLWNLVIFAGLALDNWRLEKQGEALQDSMVTMYREVFPEARNVPVPRQQMQQQLDRLQGTSAEGLFLSLLSGLSPLVHSQGGIIIEKIAFHSPQLDIELVMGSFAMLEDLKQKLSAISGLNISYQSSMKEDKQVHVHMRVTRQSS